MKACDLEGARVGAARDLLPLRDRLVQYRCLLLVAHRAPISTRLLLALPIAQSSLTWSALSLTLTEFICEHDAQCEDRAWQSAIPDMGIVPVSEYQTATVLRPDRNLVRAEQGTRVVHTSMELMRAQCCEVRTLTCQPVNTHERVFHLGVNACGCPSMRYVWVCPWAGRDVRVCQYLARVKIRAGESSTDLL